MINYYNTLGIAKTASQDEIKKAYRKLASQHHPDKGGDTAKFQEIQTAYAVLSDEQKRAAYDNPSPFGQNGFGNQGPGQPFDFDSIFNIFGANFRQQHAQQRPQSRMSLWITLHDVAVGGQRIISIGTQNGTQEIQIDLPCGLDDGDNVRYQGIGPNNSDLIVGFRIHPDKQWQRQGSTLFTDTTANVWQLITGNKVNVVDIRGNKLEVVIPPMTQPGTTLKIKGRGLPDKTGVVGDMMLRLHTRLPTAISPELMAAISKELDQ